MEESRIKRINELYHKSQAEGLTEDEKNAVANYDSLVEAEEAYEYVASIRKNLRSQLNNIDMVNEDGTIENLGEKYGNEEAN